MRRLAFVALLLPGCMLFFDDGGHRPEDKCPPAAEDHAQVAPQPLRNPDNLQCEQFGPTCNPECGPCPAATVAPIPPIPTWGVCNSTCESLGESACEASAECRVVKDARCMISLDCVTDFMGCFPIDQQPDPSVDCFRATDGWTCSRSSACSALHRQMGCGAGTGDCPRDFGLCVPEGRSPGRCHDQVVCGAPEPACPSGTKAGVANGCFTGACIPLDLCENAV